jgi:superoxide dismutase, Cu-Zn family
MRGSKLGWMAVGVLVLGCETPAMEEPEEAAEGLQERIREERGLAAPAGEGMQRRAEASDAFAGVEQLVAVLSPTEGHDARGVVRFRRVGDEGVKVTGRVEGLSPEAEHGFHVHEHGDCSAPDGESAGGHYNPAEVDHARPPEEPRHAGDMGNLKADADGVATVDTTFDTMTLVRAPAPILGRGLIVHAQPDDGSQPTGAAGPRIACGVIGVAEAGDEE